jgi:hypothetical protein
VIELLTRVSAKELVPAEELKKSVTPEKTEEVKTAIPA